MRAIDICCTARLAELLPEAAPRAVLAAKERWRADVLTVRRRRALVVMHEETGFAAVLWGVRKRELAALPATVGWLLEETLLAYGVREDAVGRYLAEERRCVHAAGRAGAGRLRDVGELLERLWDERSVPERLQLPLICRLNRYYGDRPRCPAEAMMDLLSDRFGPGTVAQQSFLLRCSLDLERYAAVRDLLVPSVYTFWQLHDVLQGAYRWSGLQDHAFLVPNSLNICYVVSDRSAVESFDGPAAWDRSAMLLDYLYPGQTLRYLYDSHDNWAVEVEVLDLREDVPFCGAICTACEGEAPRDGVGGVKAFVRLLDQRRDPEGRKGGPSGRRVTPDEINTWLS